jgi:HPt (histidine-containing phosphotransfer) domain-containing protein
VRWSRSHTDEACDEVDLVPLDEPGICFSPGLEPDRDLVLTCRGNFCHAASGAASPGPSQAMDDLDISILHGLVGDGPAIVAHVLTTYLRSILPAAVDLRAGMAARDGGCVRAAAHLIKSPSRCVGAVPLGELCEAMEQAASRSDWSLLEELFRSFDPAVERVERAVRQHIDVPSSLPTT